MPAPVGFRTAQFIQLLTQIPQPERQGAGTRNFGSRLFKHRLRVLKYRRPPRVPPKLKAGCTQRFHESPRRQSSRGQVAPRFTALLGGSNGSLLSASNLVPLRTAKTSEMRPPVWAAISLGASFPWSNPPGCLVPPSQLDKLHPWV